VKALCHSYFFFDSPIYQKSDYPFFDPAIRLFAAVCSGYVADFNVGQKSARATTFSHFPGRRPGISFSVG
jgi:hypothetical protein